VQASHNRSAVADRRFGVAAHIVEVGQVRAEEGFSLA
jgi:hypothetical protein